MDISTALSLSSDDEDLDEEVTQLNNKLLADDKPTTSNKTSDQTPSSSTTPSTNGSNNPSPTMSTRCNPPVKLALKSIIQTPIEKYHPQPISENIPHHPIYNSVPQRNMNLQRTKPREHAPVSEILFSLYQMTDKLNQNVGRAMHNPRIDEGFLKTNRPYHRN